MSPAPAPPNCPGPDRCAPVQSASRGWHLKREIQLTHIVSTLTFAAAAAGYIVNMDQRLTVIEANLAASMRAQAQRDAQQDEAAGKADALIREQLAKIDAKLDRLIERTQIVRGR